MTLVAPRYWAILSTTSPTQNIGSAPAISLVPWHYFYSEINSSRNTGEENKKEGCSSYV
jgi:hypothetical protein